VIIRTLRTSGTSGTSGTSRVFLVLLLLLLLLPSLTVSAHDIPADTIVRVFVKPEGQQLRFLVRVQMASINDVEWPIRKPEGTLDLPVLEPFLRDAATMWIADYLEVYEGNEKLSKPALTEVRLSAEGDPSFATYETALEHVTGPRLTDTKMLPNQGALDAMFDYPIKSDRSRFSFHPRWDRFGLRVVTVLQFLPPGGAVRAFEYEGGDPGLVRLDPEWYQAAWTFVKSGFFHILDGADHLLFLFCLVIPFRKFRGLIPVVTAFTVAHSITLIASAYDMAPGATWFPPLIETLIATSIVYMALENIAVVTPKRRWLMTFGFGLVHGFGFSFALRQTLQFAGSHLLTSLLAFNVGVELGQVAMLALMVPALELFFRYGVAERIGTIILSALAAHTAWHWMIERYAQLSRFQFEWPVIDAAFLAAAMRWAMVFVALAGVAWVFSLLRQSRQRRDNAPGTAHRA